MSMTRCRGLTFLIRERELVQISMKNTELQGSIKLVNNYNMKKRMEELIQTKGGKAFFRELNKACIPFFFIAAIENTEDRTEYFCETITPGTMGIRLSEDKFADHLKLQNHGFTMVLDIDPSEKTGNKSSGTVSPTDKELKAGKSDNVTTAALLDSMIRSL